MLVVKRKPNESIVVRFQGKIILTILVVEAGPWFCRLGMNADTVFEIQRAEVDCERYPADYEGAK